MSEPGVMRGRHYGGFLFACRLPSRGAGNAAVQEAAYAVMDPGAAKP